MSIFDNIIDDIFDDGRTPEQRKEAWIAQAIRGHGNVKPVDRATAERHWEANQEEGRKLKAERAKREAAKARREAINEAHRVKMRAEWKRKEDERVAGLSPEKRAEHDRAKQHFDAVRIEQARASVKYFQDELVKVLRECGVKPETAGRDQLSKALNHFANVNEGERSNAADAVERIRAKLGLSWSELIVP